MVVDVEHDDDLVAVERYGHADVHVDAHLELAGTLDPLRAQRRMPGVFGKEAQLVVDLLALPGGQFPVALHERLGWLQLVGHLYRLVQVGDEVLDVVVHGGLTCGGLGARLRGKRF